MGLHKCLHNSYLWGEAQVDYVVSAFTWIIYPQCYHNTLLFLLSPLQLISLTMKKHNILQNIGVSTIFYLLFQQMPTLHLIILIE